MTEDHYRAPKKALVPKELQPIYLAIKRYCDCGCGELINAFWKHGRYLVSQTHKRIHASRKADYHDRMSLKNKQILCKCGCGQYIKPVDKANRVHEYINGHFFRVNRFPEAAQKGADRYNWKGGIRKTDSGYTMIKVNGYHPRAGRWGYVREHILVMEEYLSKIAGGQIHIQYPWIVHHVNGDRSDNRLENLQMMTDSEHKRLEGRKKGNGRSI